MKTIETEPVISSVLEKELKELLKQRSRNTDKIGRVILKMITSKPGGLNAKNQAAVFQHLHTTLSFSMTELSEYVKVGRGLLLVDVCNMTTNSARLASRLDIKHQKTLVFDGVDVVFDLTKAPIKKRLHQLTDEEGLRVLDVKIGRIRDAKMQRQLMQAVVPPVRDRILEIWGGNDNLYLRVRKQAPLADIEFLVKELKRRGKTSVSNPHIRQQLEKDLELEFPHPHGASPA